MKQKCETYKWVKTPSSQDWSNVNLGHSWEIQPRMVVNQDLSLIAVWVGKFKSVLSKFKEKKRKKSCFSNIFRELCWWKVLDLKLLKVIFLRESIHFGPRMTKPMTPCNLKLLAVKEKTGVQVSAETIKLNPRQLCRWFAKVMMNSKMVSELNSQWCYHNLFGFFLCFPFPMSCSLVLFHAHSHHLIKLWCSQWLNKKVQEFTYIAPNPQQFLCT